MLRRRAEEREREAPDGIRSPDGHPEKMMVRSKTSLRDDIPEEDHVRDVDAMASVEERLLAEHREQRDDLGTLLRMSGFPAEHPETRLDAVLRFLDAEAAVANSKGGGPERRQLASSRVQVRLLARAIRLSSPSFSTPSPFSEQAATRLSALLSADSEASRVMPGWHWPARGCCGDHCVKGFALYTLGPPSGVLLLRASTPPSSLP